MSLSTSDIIAALGAIVGPGGVVADTAEMGAYLNEPRKRFKVPAVAVVLPGSVPELQAICRWANDNRIGLIPQGGNTGLVGAQVPLTGTEVIVSLRRLDRVREVNAAAGHMTLEAGVILEEAHKVAESAGALFPLWLASQGSARIGGELMDGQTRSG